MPRCLSTRCTGHSKRLVVRQKKNKCSGAKKMEQKADTSRIEPMARGTVTAADGVARENKRSDEVELTGQTPLGVAVMHNNLDMVKLLTQATPEQVNIQDRSGNTAMHYAVAKGNKDIINALISVEGIDLNIVNKGGQKPIAVLLQGILHCEGLEK